MQPTAMFSFVPRRPRYDLPMIAVWGRFVEPVGKDITVRTRENVLQLKELMRNQGRSLS